MWLTLTKNEVPGSGLPKLEPEQDKKNTNDNHTHYHAALFAGGSDCMRALTVVSFLKRHLFKSRCH